jgi:Mg/Co/Ni transporter MgtE
VSTARTIPGDWIFADRVATVHGVSPTRLDEAAGLTVAQVTHRRFSTLPAAATVGEVLEWFGSSASRRMAFLADGDRYVGSVMREDLEELDPGRLAADVARDGPTVAPDAPASLGEELAMLTDARRVPVVDERGHLVGVVAVTGDLRAFCGTG